jgi:hypothetical protein
MCEDVVSNDIRHPKVPAVASGSENTRHTAYDRFCPTLYSTVVTYCELPRSVTRHITFSLSVPTLCL